MGKIFKHRDVKLITSIIYRNPEILVHAENAITENFGEEEDLSLDLPFEYTDYYANEMGAPLRRKFLCLKDLVAIENIAETKLKSNIIENNLLVNANRQVNIDPGYVTEAKLVLLTTKDYSHRLYIGNNIFAEVTLHYSSKHGFMPWQWTYPDYSSQEIRNYFNSVRELYMENIKEL